MNVVGINFNLLFILDILLNLRVDSSARTAIRARCRNRRWSLSVAPRCTDEHFEIANYYNK